MRTVLSFENLASPGGSETYVLTVARELERLGHDVRVYTLNPGPMADHARELGLSVVSHEGLPADCEAVVSSDAATCFELAERFPRAARVFVCHSEDFALGYPPQLPGAAHAVVVLNDRVRRFVESQGWSCPVVRLRQPIDMGRYLRLAPPRAPARRVLASTNIVSGRRAELIEQACRDSELELSWIGSTSESTVSPELAIAASDIVIGVGRTVLEGMASGRASYVYGIGGGDGWVTGDSYAHLEADGFSGMATGAAPGAGDLSADLMAWRPDIGEASRDLVSAHHRARDHVKELVDLVRRIREDMDMTSEQAAPGHARELARLVRLEWQAELRTFQAIAERDEIAGQLERVGARVAELERDRMEELKRKTARIAELEQALAAANSSAQSGWEELAALRATRRYRWACRVAAPLDALRTAVHSLRRASRRR